MKERLEALLATGTDTAQIRFGLASALFTDGLLDDALTHAELAVQLDADYSAAWRLLGQIRLDLGRHEEAEQAFRTGLEVARKRGDQQLVRQLGVFLKRLEKNS